MRESDRTARLQPFLEYLAQTPAAELLNDYTYQLIYISTDPDEQLDRFQRLQDVVTAPGTGLKWSHVDTWRAGCAKRARQDPAAFFEDAMAWHDRHMGRPPAPACLESTALQETRWLVPGLVPLSEITLLGADGGTGKGLWTAQLVAYVTTGKTSGFFPVPPPQTGKVLVLTGEDDPGKVLKARYLAAGADMSRVFVVTADEYFLRTGHLLTLRDRALETFVADIGPLLVVVDPLQSFLPPNLEMSSRNQMRSVMTPLQALNIRYGCAALVPMHTNKRQGVSGRGRLADSSDLWDIARSVLMMGRSKADGKLYLSHEKSNYSRTQQTVLLHIEDAEQDGLPTARAVFDGYTDRRDADFQEERRIRLAQTKDDTAAAIRDILADSRLGSMPSTALRAAVTKEVGCSDRTYERAYRDLVKSGEIVKRQINQRGGVHSWFTALPLYSETDGEVIKI